MKLTVTNVLVLLIIIAIVFAAIYKLIPPNTEIDDSPDNTTIISNTIILADKSINLSSEDPITHLELIAIIGVTIDDWKSSHTTISFEQSVRRYGMQSPWLTSTSINNININTFITKSEALKLFISVANYLGIDQYPMEIDFYRNSLNSLLATTGNSHTYDALLKAYTLGLIPKHFDLNKTNENLTKIEAYEIINALLNDKHKNIPMLLLEDTSWLSVKDYNLPTGVFYAEDVISISFELSNFSNVGETIYAGVSFQDSAGKWYDVPAKKIDITKQSSKSDSINWKIPNNIMSGHYRTVFSLWDDLPSSTQATRLTYLEAVGLFRIYNYREDFSSLNTNIWKASTHKLGRTTFDSGLVSVANNNLKLLMPANTYKSGELQSINLMGYGSYEIRMKLPDAPGSITGFFMYKAPDYYFEIDIEIYNQQSGDYFLTTYANGDKRNEFFGVFPFDPTASFNNYRFDYYPDRLDYYVNDKFIVRFTSGFPHEAMYLMVNSWYPTWVDGGPANEDLEFLAEWIKY
jgi:hypothetical protein